jgi:hypothetical protein
MTDRAKSSSSDNAYWYWIYINRKLVRDFERRLGLSESLLLIFSYSNLTLEAIKTHNQDSKEVVYRRSLRAVNAAESTCASEVAWSGSGY